LIVVVIEEDLVEKVVLEKGDVVVVEVLVCWGRGYGNNVDGKAS